MLYSEKDKKETSHQLARRIIIMLLLALIPNGVSLAIMLTVRIEVLGTAIAILGGAMAVFYWGLYVTPVYAYLRYLKEIIGGRSREFTGVLTEITQDSVREGVRCKTMFFSDDAGDEQRLCYYDQVKYTDGCVLTGNHYRITVHGQSIIAIAAE